MSERKTRPLSWHNRKRAVKFKILLPLTFFEWTCEWISYYLSHWAFLNVLEYLGKLSIVVVAITYLFGAKERREQKQNSAWQVINLAHGKSGSAGRIKALESLNKDNVSLAGIDLSEAWLISIDLRKAELNDAILRKTNLSKAKLMEANLRNTQMQEAILNDANLQSANLDGADCKKGRFGNTNFTKAILTYSHFEGAALFEAKFDGADLEGIHFDGTGLKKARFVNTNLRRADFGWADVEYASFRNANLEWADLRFAQHLTQEQINEAIVYETTKLPSGFIIPKSKLKTYSRDTLSSDHHYNEIP